MSPSAPSPSRARPWPLVAAAAACLISFAAFWVAQRVAHVNMLDVMVYRAEAETLRAGGDLYAMRATSANLAMTYPPFAAVLFLPLTLVGVPLMRTLSTAGNLLLVVALVRLSLQLVRPALASPARRADLWRTTLWVAAVVVWCEPVWTTLRYGQINLLVAVAVLWDFTRREKSRWAGLGIGLATAVKLTPGLFVVLLLAAGVLLWRRDRGMNQWLRTALTATGAFLVTTLAMVVALPAESRTFWTRTLFETGRVGHAEETANQSLSGVLARLMHTDAPGLWWLAAAVLLGGAAMALAVRAAVLGDKAVAVVVTAFTALMVSPISWSHHWVWCVPLLILLYDRATLPLGLAERVVRPAWQVTGAVALAFASFALWWVPHDPGRPELDQNAGQMLLSAVYPLTATAVFAGYALVVWRTRRPEAAGPRTVPRQGTVVRERQAVAKE
ncbi:glycosyltransferase 87 family protein [Streptomyces sp. NPDC056503]|uniref:glycosyltransferase 87 family protein n=1 Tax=Streptomyces sp. NPDC056503 TaxID=3345842 RepID=UPI0036876295